MSDTQAETTAAAAMELLEEIRKLMELKGENVFKIRAFEKGAQALSGVADLRKRAEAGTLTEIPGIGKGLSEVLTEFLLKGTSRARDELAASLPPGLIELTQVPGLGPKKAIQLIEELQIHSVSELEYACRENRLLKIKGFGEKVQKKILDGIHFQKANQGRQRLDTAFETAEKLLQEILTVTKAAGGTGAGDLRVSEAGALRRRMETMSEIDFLIELPQGGKSDKSFRAELDQAIKKFCEKSGLCLPIHLHYARSERFGYELARVTGTSAHWKALGAPEPFDAFTEEDFFKRLNLPLIPPETRETGEEVELARQGSLSGILPWNGIRGVFHNHTVRSDGNATLEQMVIAAKALKYEYIGISDHSQSAFYAGGLKTPTLLEQEREVREVQERHPEIRIFWGIESDILADGSLDYEAKVLDRFDFVVASVHSRFKMEREAMTDRILEAIRNPHTSFLGHATGRLLLGRAGYDCDMERIIEEASKRRVAIEINANPARLDIDWRWGPKLRECGTEVSVNPDAHETGGLEDTLYGIAMARKALLPCSQVVNARSVQEVEKWLKRA
jgi:DNA polymerase (family 10)